MTELRIMITVPLPDDLFEQSKEIADLAEGIKTLKGILPTGSHTECELGAASKPVTRKPRSDAGQKRAKGNGMQIGPAMQNVP